MTDPEKVPCPACGFLIEPRWLTVHQATYCTGGEPRE
jgi:hypothetical protein